MNARIESVGAAARQSLHRVAGAGKDVERLLVALPTIAPQCEGTEHAGRAHGHDRGPARFRVRGRCERCGWADDRLLCAGRVGDIVRGGVKCAGCGHVPRVIEDLLFIESLGESAPVAELVAASADDVLSAFAFHERARGLAETTIRNRISSVEALERAIGSPVLEVDTAALVRFLGRPGIKAASRRVNQLALQAFFRFAVESGYRRDDPTAHLLTVKVPRGKPRPFTREQIHALLASGAYRKTRAMILLGYYQGFRVSSIARVHGHDIDVGSKTIRTLGKGSKERTLPLHPVIAELAQTMPTDSWWFPARKDPSRPMRAASATNLITKAKHRAGILDPTLTAHSLRHSFATHMIDDGVDVRVIQELMMHDTLGSTQVYLGVSERLARDGIEVLAALEIPTRSGRSATESNEEGGRE